MKAILLVTALVAASTALRLMSYNIRSGDGMAG